jgi:phage terminase large subunit-like protein
VLFGLDVGADNLALFRECTGRDVPAAGGYREAWLVVGRRGGKSIVLALIAAFLSCFIDWTPFLAPGERGTIIIIATDRKQARTIFRYLRAMLTKVPLLTPLVSRETAEALDLDNGVTIEIQTASFKTTRGYTLVAVLADELAFWSSEGSANPDTEIIGAVRPAMATVPGAVLLCASSPYARRGALWEAYRRHYGKASPDFSQALDL